jgi:hypothetical protein
MMRPDFPIQDSLEATVAVVSVAVVGVAGGIAFTPQVVLYGRAKHRHTGRQGDIPRRQPRSKNWMASSKRPSGSRAD